MSNASNSPTKVVHVAAGVIYSPAGQILIAKRPDRAHQGGLWEFPGGKLEAGEEPAQALARELQEEIGIEAQKMSPLICIRHDYPDKSVLLDVWKVESFHGDAHGKEGQPVKWVTPDELSDYQFPAANAPIVTAVQLPSRVLITPQLQANEDFSCYVEYVREDLCGSLLLVRQHEWSEQQWLEAIPLLLELCEQCSLLLNNPPVALLSDDRVTKKLNLIGLHLPAYHLQKEQWPELFYQCRWVSAACHNEQEIVLAESMKVDFVTLSPVLETSSHPGQSTLGWDEFQRLVSKAKIPVFALGGMTRDFHKAAIARGAQGIAGISTWI